MRCPSIIPTILVILVLRLEWLHATASRDRWYEEMILLFEELRRVGASWRFEERKWMEFQTWGGKDGKAVLNERLVKGVRAHAMKKAAMFNELAKAAEQRYRNVQLTSPPRKKVRSSNRNARAL